VLSALFFAPRAPLDAARFLRVLIKADITLFRYAGNKKAEAGAFRLSGFYVRVAAG